MPAGDLSLQQLYIQQLQPILQRLETERLRVRSRFLKTGLAVLPLVLIAGYFWGLFGCMGGAIAAVVLVLVINDSPLKDYRTHFQQQVIQRLVKCHSANLYDSLQEGIPEDAFRACQSYRHKIDRYHCEDWMMGKMGETQFRFCKDRQVSLADIQLAQDMIEDLNLNTRIWGK